MEEYRVCFDAAKMFPQAAERVDVLEKLKRSWPVIVGNNALAKYSRPYDLGVNELCVCVTDTRAKIMLKNSKGNIARRISQRFGYDFGKDFVLTITDNIPKLSMPDKPTVEPKITLDEEKIRQYMQDAPDTLPEDINYAISCLQVFWEQKAAANPRQHT